MTPEQVLDALTDLVALRLEQRGYVKVAPPSAAPAKPTPKSPAPTAYDDAACARFFDAAHISDNVLKRAEPFFSELAATGEVTSQEVVAMLSLKGATSIAANLTNPLKKSRDRLGLGDPWREELTSDHRTRWCDRNGIASRMLRAIKAERARRGI